MPTVNEYLRDDAIRHAVDFDRYTRGVVQRMVAVLNRADARIAAELAVRLADIDAGQQTTTLLEAVLASVRQLNAQAYQVIGRELTAELQALAGVESEYVGELLRAAIPVQVSVTTVTAQQAYAAAMARPFQGVLLREALSELEDGHARRFRDAIRQGFVEGKTTQAIVREIRGTRARQYADGIVQMDRRRLEAVVRTALSHTAAVAREQVYDANPDLIKGFRWTSTLDLRTTEPCRIRDGRLYDRDRKPVGHSIPWLAGPGRLHWNAIPAGSMIATNRGQVAIENVRVGDLVLTHSGSFKPVTDKLSKRNERGIIRVARTESGRVLRATDDHPVLTASAGWKFMGSLEAGDEVFCDPEQLPEVGFVAGAVVPNAKDGPSLRDERQVALDRTLQLMTSVVDLECNPEIGPGEVEDKAIEVVLGNPAFIESKCALHHLLALAELLSKFGRERLGELLYDLSARRDTAHALGLSAVESDPLFGGHDSGENFGDFGRVAGCHARRVGRISGAGIFGRPESPVPVSGGGGPAPALEVNTRLLGLGPNGVSGDLRVPGERAIGEPVIPFDGAQRKPALDVLNENELAMVGQRFGHDRILALEVSHYDSNVYDLGVESDASYVCNGIVVSNCRSTEIIVTPSYRELGLDLDEVAPGTRASMDGQVPADRSYADWIKAQSAARQDEILGPSRGKLLRAGGLELGDLYSRRGEPLTLDELRARHRAAFERAGV